MQSPLKVSGVHRVSSLGRLSPGRGRQQPSPGKGSLRPANVRKQLLRLLLAYGLISLIAIPSLTWHFESASKTVLWRPSNIFVLGMNYMWRMSPLTKEPGAHVAQQPDDFACLMVLQDVCYSFNPRASGPSLSRSRGVWFARDGYRNLSKIDFSQDVCTLHKTEFPTSLKKSLYMGEDPHDLSVIQQRVGDFVHLDYMQTYWKGWQVVMDRYSFWNQYFPFWHKPMDLPPSSEMIPVALISSRDSHLGHFVELVGGLAEVGKHLFSGNDEEDPFLQPVPSNVSLFFPMSTHVGTWTLGMTHILLGSKASVYPRKNTSHTVCFQNALFPLNIPHTDDSADRVRQRAYDAVGLPYVSPEALKRQESLNGRRNRGSNRAKQTRKTVGVIDSVRGMREAEANGKMEVEVNEVITNREGRGELLGKDHSRALLHLETEAHEETENIFHDGLLHEFHREGGLRMLQGLPAGQRPGKDRPLAAGNARHRVNYQITLVQRLHSRTIANLEEVQILLRKVFPKLPVEVVVLEKLSLEEQIQVLHRTVLYVSMHGAAMSNTILLQRGVTVVEIFPYKFFYGVYRRICQRYGINYFLWHNQLSNHSSYTDNCLVAGGFVDWPEHKCHTTPTCRWCVRDRCITTVHLEEFQKVLEPAVRQVSKWLDSHGSFYYAPTTLKLIGVT